MSEKPTRKYIDRHKYLLAEQELWKDEWMEIRDFILPRTGRFDDDDGPNQGESRYDNIFDGTAQRALRVLAAGMQGGLTSPARPWFRLSLYDEELMSIASVKQWLDECQKRMYARFAKSNFYNAIHRVYQEEGGYGQAVIIIEEDEEDGVRFPVLTAGEYCLAESRRGIVDTLYRTVWLQARQLEQMFGKENLAIEIQNNLDGERDGANPYEWYQVLHVIQPRKNYDPEKIDAENMPYESVWIDLNGEQKILRKSGYQELPMAAPRWMSIGGDSYGRSPGHDVLGDTKMLQEMTEDLLSALQKVIDPPLKAGGNLKSEVSHMAGTVTYTDPQMADSLKPIYEVRLDIDHMRQAIQDVRMQIREGLYNDLFLMLVEPRPNMTATEVSERHEEKLLMLGPVIERQFHELLNPIIDRVFAIMWRNGELPPPPEELLDAMQNDENLSRIKVEYISLLAQAQKLVTTQSIRAVSDYVTGMSQFVPQILDKLNTDTAVDEYAEATGAPSSIIRTDDQTDEIRKARLQEQLRQEQEEREAQAIMAAKEMGDTNTEEGSALGDLKKAMEPGA
jgi:hypothetical protein